MAAPLIARAAMMAAKKLLKKKKPQATKLTQKEFEAKAKKHGKRPAEDAKERYKDTMNPKRKDPMKDMAKKPRRSGRMATKKGK